MGMSPRRWARSLKQQLLVLWFAVRHPGTPWFAKALAAAVVVYAFSPIDLIPDFIPVLGYLDDVILVPIGIWCVLRLLPENVRTECRTSAEEWIASGQPKPRSTIGAGLVILVWIALAIAGWYWAGDWGKDWLAW